VVGGGGGLVGRRGVGASRQRRGSGGGGRGGRWPGGGGVGASRQIRGSDGAQPCTTNQQATQLAQVHIRHLGQATCCRVKPLPVACSEVVIVRVNMTSLCVEAKQKLSTKVMLLPCHPPPSLFKRSDPCNLQQPG
jgi:hypothetical protein